MSRTYGAEAGRACLIQQILSVFHVWITIDRHLALWQTICFTGKFVGMNRIGIKETKSSSPFQKMSFGMRNIFNKRNCSRRDGQLNQSIVSDCARCLAGLGTGNVLVDYERMVELGETSTAKRAAFGQ